MAVKYKGTPISRGCALGHVCIVEDSPLEVAGYTVENPNHEIQRFRKSHAAAVLETQEMLKALQGTDGDAAAILDAQLSLLQDEYSVISPIEDMIASMALNQERAIDRVLGEIIELFAQAEDEYIRQRSADAEDVRRRLLRAALGIRIPDYSHLPKGTVLVARELTPSDTISMDLAHVAAIVTERGGYYSHVGIITRGRGIPSVTGVDGAAALFSNSEEILVDGDHGTVMAGLSQRERDEFYADQKARQARLNSLARFRTRESRSCDGVPGMLCANIGNDTEAHDALAGGADGVGLLRSEFLYMDRKELPDEEIQFQAYRSVLQNMGNRPVIIRTLDVGGDKFLPALPMEHEENPFLGRRAIRLCLAKPELLHTQLRALLRASVYGNLGIMFPMISEMEELRTAKQMLGLVRKELEDAGVPVAPVRVGMMVEVPSVAVMADSFAAEVDFFSIGTNDLIQYTLAVERGNELVDHLYSPYHPAVLRLISFTAQAAKNHRITCGMCGEAAAIPELLPVFWGMGIRELSMSHTSILEMRQMLAGLNTEACESLARRILALGEESQIKQALCAAVPRAEKYL